MTTRSPRNSTSSFSSIDKNKTFVHLKRKFSKTYARIVAHKPCKKNSFEINDLQVDVNGNEEMTRKLERALKDRRFRTDLVTALLAQHSGYAMKIRFFSTLVDYDNTSNGKLRREKGRKIIMTFIGKESKFHISIPYIYEQRLLSFQFDTFPLVREYVLGELIKQDLVRELLSQCQY